jgi:PAP2 superfamily protein
MLHALAAAVAISMAQVPAVHDVQVNWAADGTFTGGGLALYVASEFAFKPALAPAACRWCDRDANGVDALNPLDAALRSAAVWPVDRQGQADALSSVDVYLLMPAAMYGLDGYMASRSGSIGRWGEDAVIITEATVAAALLNQAVKFIAGRERPFVHVLPDDEKASTENPLDNNVSFYSGHTTTAFAMLFATLSVAELRAYPQRWLLWAVGVPVALAAPYLRMASDRHYFTDVLAGAVVGGAVGWFLPVLLHPRHDVAAAGQQGQAVQVSVGPSVVSVAVAFP